MFDKLKLRNRIFLGSTIPIALSILAAGLVFAKANQAKGQVSKVDRHDIVGLQRDTEIGMLLMQREILSYVNEPNNESLNEYKEGKEEFEASIEELKSLISDSEQKADLAQIEALGKQTDTINSQIVALAKAGKIEEARQRLKKGDFEQIDRSLETVTDKFEERENEILEQNKEAVSNSLSFLIALVVGSALVAALLSVAINYLIAGGISKAIGNTINTLVSFLNEIAATVEQQERTIANQASSVNQTSTTIDELGSSSRQSAEQAESSTKEANQVLELSEKGSKAVEQTLEGITNLKDNVRAIAEQIMRLSEQTGQIASISDLVADIANQTNMLALNAAVEAARAGEQGKGFSVVASEIRKLADESKKSAEKINTLVMDLQASMNSTVMVTDEGSKKTQQSLNLAKEMADTFTGVTDAVNNVFLNNQQIFLSSKQQAVAVQQVLAAMNALNLGAKETVSGINQVKVSTEQLKETAKQLQAIV